MRRGWGIQESMMDIVIIYEERQNFSTIQQWMSKNLIFFVKIEKKFFPRNVIFRIFSSVSYIE